MRIRSVAALLALTVALLWAGGASADGPLTLEGRTASSLTVSWSWGGQTASAWDLAWQARGDDDAVAWRSVRKTAAQRRHTIEELEAGMRYIVRVRALDSNDRPFASLQGAFATSSAAAGQSLDPRLRRGLAERLTLELESSRELCTAGTLTEISWQISGGKPPHKLQVEGTPVNADADNIRINCGVLSEAEAADEAAALAAKRVTAVVTDARGVRREAALDVARARALPALDAVGDIRPYHDALTFTWGGIDVSRCSTAECYALRWRPIGEATWRIALFQFSPHVSDALDFYIDGLSSGRSYEAATAAIRDRIENETPDALIWSSTLRGVTLTIPTGLTAAATYDTVTLRWDRQPSATQYYVWLNGGDGGLSNHITDDDEAAWGDPSSEFHEVVFRDLPSGMEFTAVVVSEYASDGSSMEATTKVRTLPMPSDREALPRGPQNLRVTATPTSITATWDEPFSGAPSGYIVSLYHPSVETPWLEWVWAPDLTVTFSGLQSNVTYRLAVEQLGPVANPAEVSIATGDAPPSAAQGAAGDSDAEQETPRLHFFPIWPMAIDGDYAMTDDPFEWRAGDIDNRGVTAYAATTVLRYNAYDAAGEAASAGNYAFLSDSDGAASVVATYEGLRDGTAKRLLIHKSDAQGVSRATLYDAVAAGDFFEWRESDDCWVRYRVTEVLPDPPGAAPRKLLAVEWTTYAFSGCSGAIAVNAAVVFDWGPLPNLGGVSLAVPIRHGPFQLAPEDWSGPVEKDPFRPWPANSYAKSVVTADLAEARRLPHWRDPTLPSGWTFVLASSGDPSYDPPNGYCAGWANDRGYGGVEICGGFYLGRDRPWESSWNDGRGVVETRTIVGRSSIVVYSPPGPNHNRYRSIQIWVYDSTPGAVYRVRGLDWTLNGSNVDAVIAIARSLFEGAD